jgi:hypothetical protein
MEREREKGTQKNLKEALRGNRDTHFYPFATLPLEFAQRTQSFCPDLGDSPWPP